MRLGEAVLGDGFAVGDPWRAAVELLLRRRARAAGRERPPAARRSRRRSTAALPHRARARRQRARDPGPARNRQDLHRRAHHLRARACGSQGRRHRGQPQGDRQRARSGREAGARAGARRAHRPPRRRRVRQASGASTRTEDYEAIRARSHGRPHRRGRRHGVVLGAAGIRAERRRADRRRGRADVARQRARDRARPHAASCCSAIRSSSSSRCRAVTPRAARCRRSYHLLDGERRCRRTRACSSPRRGACIRTIAKFTSEVYYEGKVGRARDSSDKRSCGWRAEWHGDAACIAVRRVAVGSGLRYVPVAHTGNRARAAEEVVAIRDLVEQLLRRCSWRDKDGVVQPLDGRATS